MGWDPNGGPVASDNDDASCIFPGILTCLGDLDGVNTAGTSALLALLSMFGTV